MGQETGSAKLHLGKTPIRFPWLKRYAHLPVGERPAPLIPCINGQGKEVEEYCRLYAATLFKAAGARGMTQNEVMLRGGLRGMSGPMRRKVIEYWVACGGLRWTALAPTVKGGRPRVAWVWVGP